MRACFVHVTPRLTNSFGVVPGPQKQLRGPVPEGHYHGVEVRQWLEGRVEESGETHVRYRRRGEKTDEDSRERHYQRVETRLLPGHQAHETAPEAR